MVEIPVIHSPFELPEYTRTRRRAMFHSALRLQKIDTADAVVAELDRLYCLGGQIHEIIRRWRDWPLPETQSIQPRWRLAMIVTAGEIQSSFRRTQDRLALYPRMTHSLPYWRVMTVTDGCKRSPHNWLDGFAARWDDAIWKVLEPPFGWECGCLINPIWKADLPWGLEPLQAGIGRVPKDVLRAAVGWMARSQLYLWDKSISPRRPHVPAEKWKADPIFLSSEEDRALLTKYGISIEITKTDDSTKR